MPTVSVAVPATTANLGPGFDCAGLALGLENLVHATALAEPRWSVTIEGRGRGTLPTGADNLVAEAMRRVFERCGGPAGAVIRQVNQIPLTSGLGSSAAARVGGLVAANELCGRPLTTDDLAELATALEGHPDNVVPALVGGLTIAVADGPRVPYVRFDPPPFKAVVLHPDQELPTAASRQVLPASYSRQDAVFNVGRASLLVAALAQGRFDLLRCAMDDRLHQPHRLKLIPGGREVFEAALEAGALGVAISGAGPSIVAFCEANALSVSAAMTATWRGYGVDATARVLALAAEGARRLPDAVPEQA